MNGIGASVLYKTSCLVVEESVTGMRAQRSARSYETTNIIVRRRSGGLAVAVCGGDGCGGRGRPIGDGGN